MFKYKTLLLLLLCFFSCTEAVKIKKEANEAKLKSDSLLREFKKIEEDLKNTGLAIDSLNKLAIDSVNKIK